MPKLITHEYLKGIFREIDELIEECKDVKPVPFKISKFKLGYEMIKRRYLKD